MRAIAKALWILPLLPALCVLSTQAASKSEDPDAAWLERSRWYARKGDFETSINIVKKLAKRDPHNYLHSYRLGYGYFMAGQFHQALAYFELTQRQNPQAKIIGFNIARTYTRIGTLLLRRGRLDEAIAAFRKGAERIPTYWRNHHWLGRVLLYQNRYAEALPWLEAARDRNPLNFNPRRDLGFCYLQLGRLEDARAEFEGALRANPTNLSSRFNLGLIYARQGLWRQAARQFHLAVTMGVSKEAFKPRTA